MEFDSQTLFFIMIGLFIVQFLIMRYYVSSSQEIEINRNNKKMLKKMTEQIQTTLQQHLAVHNVESVNSTHQRIPHRDMRVQKHQRRDHQEVEEENDNMDSMDDPVEASSPDF